MNGREAIMPASMRQLPLLNVVIALVLVVASLYWARAVLIYDMRVSSADLLTAEGHPSPESAQAPSLG